VNRLINSISRVANLRLGTLILLILSARPSAGAADFYYRLARYHAPAVIQELGQDPGADIFTRFVDFDGDDLADNNWENTHKFPLEPAVYYEVLETDTHYFITYAYFHPRDYLNFWFCLPVLCHENDLEGAILTVKKNGNAYGRVLFAEALAHSSIAGGRIFRTYADKVALLIESGGHGIYLWNGTLPGRFEIFALKRDRRLIGKLGARVPRKFALVAMKHLWDLQDKGRRATLGRFDFDGRFHLKHLFSSFAGKKFGTAQAQLPWGWKSFAGERGEWFLDPALWVYRKLRRPRGFSLTYLHHPYLNRPLLAAFHGSSPKAPGARAVEKYQ
jgi:hypothetical protein